MSTVRSSHLERTAAEPRSKELLPAVISRIDQVNARVRLFRLELQSGPTQFSAGQWLDTFVPGVARAGGFTITSSPSAAAAAAVPTPYLELAVQESPDNAPAAWLWRPVDEIMGQTLQVRIGGSFVFPPQDAGDIQGVRRVVFIAGGVGVNPLMSMLTYLAENPCEDVHIEVMYASKMPPEGVRGVLFLDRIVRLFGEAKLQGRLSLYLTGSETTAMKQEEQSIHGAVVHIRRARISRETLSGLVGGTNRDSSLVYICGPQAMTDTFVDTLTDPDGIAMAPWRVKTEKWW